MPSERFYKLNQEKRDRIVTACLDEFIRRGYKDASINQIIKDADISRGSFYTYFEDKTEIFVYIINMLKDSSSSIVITTLKNEDGDLFRTCKKLIGLAINADHEANDKSTQLFYSLLRDFDIMGHLKEVMENTPPKSVDASHKIESVFDLIYDNLNDIKVNMSREMFYIVADMLINISIKSLVIIKNYPAGVDKEIKTLFTQYDIIERGIRA